MLRKELIKKLEEFEGNDHVLISNCTGWSNIHEVKQVGPNINLIIEKYPLFSDN